MFKILSINMEEEIWYPQASQKRDKMTLEKAGCKSDQVLVSFTRERSVRTSDLFSQINYLITYLPNLIRFNPFDGTSKLSGV